MTLSKVGIEDSMIHPKGMMVGFDDAKTSTCREVDLKTVVGPYEFGVSFVSANILSVFNLLLASLEYT